MNNRLMQRIKAWNYTVFEFPIFTEENSDRYETIRKELCGDLMLRTIARLSHRKWKTDPKFRKKRLDMIHRYQEFIMENCEEMCTMDHYKFIYDNPITAQEE